MAGRRAGGFLRAGGQGTAKVVGGAPTVRRGEAAVREYVAMWKYLEYVVRAPEAGVASRTMSRRPIVRGKGWGGCPNQMYTSPPQPLGFSGESVLPIYFMYGTSQGPIEKTI